MWGCSCSYLYWTEQFERRQKGNGRERDRGDLSESNLGHGNMMGCMEFNFKNVIFLSWFFLHPTTPTYILLLL